MLTAPINPRNESLGGTSLKMGIIVVKKSVRGDEKGEGGRDREKGIKKEA
jgi:hypothetical protein